ncbi:glycosyl transferase family 2 [Lapidilactobacillus concavus]|nr:glycosyl transferase family 2 [Lapidilactobacillus concavus]
MTYNSPDIFKTLDNFTSEILPNFACRIYIYDNNSDESFKNRLSTYEGERVQIHFSSKNSGFGHGHNYNVNRFHEEFLLICNPDILVSQADFQKLWNYLHANRNVMVAPKVVYPDAKVQYLIRRKLDVFDYMLRFIPFKFVKKMFDRRLSAFECRDLSDDIQTVKFASGCFMFTRVSDFSQVGGFDERFFMYFEDNDFCQKFRQQKKQIVYFPDAAVIHFYGKEAHRSFKVFKIFITSMVQYFNKWGWKFF